MQTYGTLSLFERHEQLIPEQFINTDLGKLYQAIPWEEIAVLIPPVKRDRSGQGRKNLLSVRGGIGLMFLKHYLGVSDQMLIDRLNTDWSMQYFCGIQLGTKQIKNKNLVSDWRNYIGQHLDIAQWQQFFAKYWKPVMKETHVGMSDATAYESYIRHPNDVILLWQGCEFIYQCIVSHCRDHRIRKPRIRFEKKLQQVMQYQRNRKKSRRRSRQMRRRLIGFLDKLLQRSEQLDIQLNQKDQQRLKTIRILFHQQKQHFKYPEEKIKNRIVSISKPYVRPIIRGKEVKSVEFGAKVNLLQVDGINFIEHLSYNAFNEGNRLITAIRLHRKLFGACHQFAADKIYATNKNRTYCRVQQIATNFIPKGRQGEYAEQSEQLRKQLGKQRATVLEGSFGNEKNHYLLQKIKARNQDNEAVWIFFGIMTCNAVQIAKRIQRSLRQAA